MAKLGVSSGVRPTELGTISLVNSGSMCCRSAGPLWGHGGIRSIGTEQSDCNNTGVFECTTEVLYSNTPWILSCLDTFGHIGTDCINELIILY